MPDQSFHVGDKITHNVFGNGRIKSILSDRNAYLIKFDQMETPRMISFRVPIKKSDFIIYDYFISMICDETDQISETYIQKESLIFNFKGFFLLIL